MEEVKHIQTRVLRAASTGGDRSKTYIVTYTDRTFVRQLVLTRTPDKYFEYEVIKTFKEYSLIDKRILFNNDTWMGIAQGIYMNLKDGNTNNK